MNYIFEYRNEKGNNCRVSVYTTDYGYAWFKALQTCGYDNRTSLGLIGNDGERQIRNGIIINWWELQSLMHTDSRLKNFRLSQSWCLTDKLNSGYYKIVSV